MNKKLFSSFTLLLIGLLCSASSSAAQIPAQQLNTYYPAPNNNSKTSTTDVGEATQSFKSPIFEVSPLPAGATPGPSSIFLSSDGELNFSNSWGDIKDVSIWKKNINQVYLPAEFLFLGIGTDSPTAGVHIVDMPILAEGMSAIPKEGAGRRMMYYGDKNAFRVGEVTGSEWNDVNVGLNSAVIGGVDNVASKLNSGVFAGNQNIASGIGSVVVGGSQNTAFGDGATIIGGSNNTADDGATVIGASGVDALQNTTVIGNPPSGLTGSLGPNNTYLFAESLMVGAVPNINLNNFQETFAVLGHISFGSETNRLKPKGAPDYRAEFNMKLRDDGTSIFSTTNLISSSKISDGNFRVDYTNVGCLQAAHVTFTPISGMPVITYLKQNTKNTSVVAFVDLGGNPVNVPSLVSVSCTLNESFDGVHPYNAGTFSSFIGESTMSLDPRAGTGTLAPLPISGVGSFSTGP